jgi:hypothetical protein
MDRDEESLYSELTSFLYQSNCGSLMQPRSAQISETGLHVEVRGDLIIVTESATRFFAIYAKPSQPRLILRQSAPTGGEVLGRAWKAASDKAREVGWIA